MKCPTSVELTSPLFPILKCTKDVSVSKCPDRSALSRSHSLFWVKRLHCQLFMCYQLFTRHFPWSEKVASKNNTVCFLATFKRNTTNDMSQIKSIKAYRGAVFSRRRLWCVCATKTVQVKQRQLKNHMKHLTVTCPNPEWRLNSQPHSKVHFICLSHTSTCFKISTIVNTVPFSIRMKTEHSNKSLLTPERLLVFQKWHCSDSETQRGAESHVQNLSL